MLTDHLDATKLVIDETGLTVWRAKLTPYGVANSETGEKFHQPLRFPGHFYDVETRLHYNRFRYYDPAIAGYLESDSLGVEGGLNLYAYTRNLLREVDLRGLRADCPDGENCPLRRSSRFEDNPSGERNGVTRRESPPEPGKTLSNGDPMPPGTIRVEYSDGTRKAIYYVDPQGRTVRAEVPLQPPATYKKEGVSDVMPGGYETGRDHRGHLAPERGAPNQDLVNVPGT